MCVIRFVVDLVGRRKRVSFTHKFHTTNIHTETHNDKYKSNNINNKRLLNLIIVINVIFRNMKCVKLEIPQKQAYGGGLIDWFGLHKSHTDIAAVFAFLSTLMQLKQSHSFQKLIKSYKVMTQFTYILITKWYFITLILVMLVQYLYRIVLFTVM